MQCQNQLYYGRGLGRCLHLKCVAMMAFLTSELDGLAQVQVYLDNHRSPRLGRPALVGLHMEGQDTQADRLTVRKGTIFKIHILLSVL